MPAQGRQGDRLGREENPDGTRDGTGEPILEREKKPPEETPTAFLRV